MIVLAGKFLQESWRAIWRGVIYNDNFIRGVSGLFDYRFQALLSELLVFVGEQDQAHFRI